MTRLAHTGFELGTQLNNTAGGTNPFFDVARGGNVITSSPTPRNGTYAWSSNTGGPPDVKSITTSAVTLFTRFGAYLPNWSTEYFVSIGDGLGTAQSNCQVAIGMDTAGHLRIRNGDPYGGTILWTSSVVVSMNVWHLIEFKVKIDASTGTFQLKIDGTAETEQTGLNTRGAATTAIGYWAFGGIGRNGSAAFFDDFAINDDQGSTNNGYIGNGKVVLMAPVGAGGHTALNNTVGSSTHWQNVDEIPANDATDYNYDDATIGTNHIDTYTLTTLSNIGTVNAIIIYVKAQNDDASNANMKIVTRMASTDYESAATAMTQTWAWYNQLRETNPNTSAAWTSTNLGVLEVGFDAQ